MVIIIIVIIILIGLWFSFREADREYMRCVCGKQPVKKVEKYTGSHGYFCVNCGLESYPAINEMDAKEEWHKLVVVRNVKTVV